MKFRSILCVALLCSASLAIADSSNGDMSDRGGSFQELAAGQSWGQYDGSDAAFFEHFFGPDWRCTMLGQGCKYIPPIAPTPPIPEPASWLLALVGLAVILLQKGWK